MHKHLTRHNSTLGISMQINPRYSFFSFISCIIDSREQNTNLMFIICLFRVNNNNRHHLFHRKEVTQSTPHRVQLLRLLLLLLHRTKNNLSKRITWANWTKPRRAWLNKRMFDLSKWLENEQLIMCTTISIKSTMTSASSSCTSWSTAAFHAIATTTSRIWSTRINRWSVAKRSRRRRFKWNTKISLNSSKSILIISSLWKLGRLFQKHIAHISAYRNTRQNLRRIARRSSKHCNLRRFQSTVLTIAAAWTSPRLEGFPWN